MTTDRFASWIQIVGNFGLLAGLVLVGVQIQQNTTAVKAQMLSDQMAASIALRLTIAGENPAVAMSKAIDAPDELTTEELVVLQNIQLANYLYRARNELSLSLGVGSPFSIETGAEASAAEFFGTPYGLAWWEMNKATLWPTAAPETAVRIEELLDTAGPDYQHTSKRELELLRNQIAVLQQQ